jgi:energy-coupling factor transport system ATP-binding protein
MEVPQGFLPSEPTLQITDLSFRYRSREIHAISDISLQLKPGELVLIAGPSGCGKTTLARCINGLIPHSYKGEMSGQITVSGKDTSGMTLSQIARNIGTVLQDPERQILGTKVVNEVAFGLENLGLPREEIIVRVNAAMEQLRILDLRDRETFNLSGGEKQKVALAGVLAIEPKLLLLDEPLASLDPASAQDALRMIRELADGGMAVLIVEHRVEDVLKINPDRILFMQDGRVQYDGPAERLSKAVNYREVKLPAHLIIKRAAQEPQPDATHLPGLAAPERTSSEPLVRFEHVSFGYEEGNNVLHNINLEIYQGDIIAILGPNGAGKTTLVKQAIGLLKPVEGAIWVDGKDTREISVAQVAKTLGYVFQSPSHMLFAPSVREELAFGPKNIGYPPEEIEKEVQKAIKIMNLSGMEADPPLALSFGQQKRVSIAAILAMKSRILVMDEPTAGQDYRNYMGFMDAILQVPNFASILFITHDIDMAVVFANRVLLVSDGRLIADGPPQEVLADYDRLRASRLVPTSLLDLNLEMLDRSGCFMRAEELAYVRS